jgi:hypothetical protein
MGAISVPLQRGSDGGSRFITSRGLERIALQLVIAAMLLRICRLQHWVAAIHGFNTILSAVLGIWFSVSILREWKSHIPDPKKPHPFPWMLGPLVIALLCLTTDGADSYVYEIYGGRMSSRSLVEGFNFSVQTVTTVGYGNWPIQNTPPTYGESQFYELREYSIFLMIAGASLFSMIVGMITTWLMKE